MVTSRRNAPQSAARRHPQFRRVVEDSLVCLEGELHCLACSLGTTLSLDVFKPHPDEIVSSFSGPSGRGVQVHVGLAEGNQFLKARRRELQLLLWLVAAEKRAAHRPAWREHRKPTASL